MPTEPHALAALLAHADWVHRLSLQLCRDQHAAADAAQRTLLAALRAPLPTAHAWRAFLARTLRNMLRLRAREDDRRTRREQHVAREAFAAAAADVAERAELHRFLVHAVLALPEPQRTLVLLHYFDGEPTAAVAARTGLSEDAVRAHLRRARDTLRTRLGAGGENGENGAAARAFAALLAAVPATAAGAPGKLALGAAVAAAALLWWAPWAANSAPPPGATLPAQPTVARSTIAPDAATPRAREPAPTHDGAATAATTGSLRGRVVWADGSPAIGLPIEVLPNHGDPWSVYSLRTDERGAFAASDLQPERGGLDVASRRGVPFVIEAGAVTELTIELPAGATVRGRVVDELGNPLPAARLWLSRIGNGSAGMDAGPVERDGTFVLRDVNGRADGIYVAAVAPGRRVSTLTAIFGGPGDVQDVRIELREPGVALHGRVLRPDGTPAAGARVLVGHIANVPWWRDEVWRTARPPVAARCDERGAFTAVGLPAAAREAIWVRDVDTAAWHAILDLPATGEHHVHVQLQRGATFAGTVRDAAGAPAPRVGIHALPAAHWDLTRRDGQFAGPKWATSETATDVDGRYELRHVTPGALRLLAVREEPPARVLADTVAVDAHTATWDAVLGPGRTIRGVVVDDLGEPLAGWDVHARGDRGYTARRPVTDAAGRFQVDDCGDGCWQVQVYAPGANWKVPSARAFCVRADAELRLVVPRAELPSAWLIGRIGGGAAGATRLLRFWRAGSFTSEVIATETDGTFRVGLLPPGTYRVAADVDGRCAPWSERFVLRAGEQRDLGTFAPWPTGDLLATATDATGRPLDDVTCWVIQDLEGRDLPVAQVRTSAGRVELRGALAPGAYRLRVVDPRHPRSEVAFAIAAGAETVVALRVAAGHEVALRLESPRDGGVLTYSLQWTLDGVRGVQELLPVNTAEGRSLLRWLAAGEHVMTATDPLGGVATTRFAIGPDGAITHAPEVAQDASTTRRTGQRPSVDDGPRSAGGAAPRTVRILLP